MIHIVRRFAPALALVAVFVIGSSAIAAETKGKVKNVTPDKHEFVIADDGGKNWTISVAKDCKCTLNDKECKFSDLQADDEVAVTYEKDGEKLIASVVKATRK